MPYFFWRVKCLFCAYFCLFCAFCGYAQGAVVDNSVDVLWITFMPHFASGLDSLKNLCYIVFTGQAVNNNQKSFFSYPLRLTGGDIFI